jgi:glycosyltransferase involved in cell wall biosynthesis
VSDVREKDSVTIDVIVTLYNGASYLGEFLASLGAQTHRGWRLWARDDGSSDETLTVLRRAATADPRITLLESGGRRLGPAAGFGWLLERVPSTARYVMCADQDDVWLPGKIERTLMAMRAAEAGGDGPILVHTDLVVVDEHLRVIDPSFWHFSGVDPEPVPLRRLAVQNVVTGATLMLNRPLRELIGVMPVEAVYQDWWYAYVAAAFGRIVALRESTILYRQHGANAVGAKRVAPPHWTELPRLARDAMARKAQLRAEIARSARQAGAFLARYGDRLSESDRRFLAAYARLPGLGSFRRKLEVARLRVVPDHGLWRNLGILLRA